MALHWNIEDVENSDHVCFIRREPMPSDGRAPDEDGKIRVLNPVTHALIFLTISIGMGKITGENASEFFARVATVERLHGAMVYKRDDETGKMEDHFITAEEVAAHIGLSTNVSTESRAQFRKRQVESFMTDRLNEYKSFTLKQMGEATKTEATA